MRFPFRRSVGDDLRDLFAHDRLNAQTNHLGHSSLSPGEGSFDILDAAGNVVAVYGHHAGKSGFLMPNGTGGWQTVSERIAAENAVLTDRLDSHASRIGAVEGRAGTLEGRADSHAQRIGAAENDISALQSGKVSQSTHNALAGRVGAVENDVSGIKDGTVSMQSPTMVSPKITGITSQAQGGQWVPLLINKSTGALRFMNLS